MPYSIILIHTDIAQFCSTVHQESDITKVRRNDWQDDDGGFGVQHIMSMIDKYLVKCAVSTAAPYTQSMCNRKFESKSKSDFSTLHIDSSFLMPANCRPMPIHRDFMIVIVKVKKQWAFKRDSLSIIQVYKQCEKFLTMTSLLDMPHRSLIFVTSLTKRRKCHIDAKTQKTCLKSDWSGFRFTPLINQRIAKNNGK